MKAIRLHARGGPESLRFEDAPTPRPGPGEVLVRVHAAAVTPTELIWAPTWTTRGGGQRAARVRAHLPRLLGWDAIRLGRRFIPGAVHPPR